MSKRIIAVKYNDEINFGNEKFISKFKFSDYTVQTKEYVKEYMSLISRLTDTPIENSKFYYVEGKEGKSYIKLIRLEDGDFYFKTENDGIDENNLGKLPTFE